MIEFRLPDVGEGIASADIIGWLVAAGDHVTEGQDLVEIQTDKAIVVIPSPVTGVVQRLGAAAGESLDVGAVLAVLAPDGEGAPGAAAADPETAAVAPARRPLAAPATRRLARELGIELAGVSGSGPNGRIMPEDLQDAAPADAPPGRDGSPAGDGSPVSAGAPVAEAGRTGAGPIGGQTVPLRGVRRTIAQTLTRAWQEIPHVIDYREVDATGLMEARRLLRQRALDRGDDALAQALSPTPLITKAAATALGEHPYVNASIDLVRQEITLHEQINLGIATATPQGLVVPVVPDANRKSVTELALEIAELARLAREGRLRPDQVNGGTFTVNNYGGLGIWLGTPIIRPPEVANLGVGAVRDRVVAVNGEPAVRPILVLAVSGDHRVLDGHTLAAFVTQMVELLEQPLLLLEGLR